MSSFMDAMYSFFGYPNEKIVKECCEPECLETDNICKSTSKCKIHCTEAKHTHCKKFKCVNDTNICPVSSKCPRHCTKKGHPHCANIYCFNNVNLTPDFVCERECPGLKLNEKVKKCVYGKCDSLGLCEANNFRCKKHCCKQEHSHCKKNNCEGIKCDDSDYCRFHCLTKTHNHCAFFCAEDKTECPTH